MRTTFSLALLSLLAAGAIQSAAAAELELITPNRPVPSLKAVGPAAFPSPLTQTPYDRDYRRWKISILPVLASQVLDATSSYGLVEANPFLSGSNGRFGAKSIVLKGGATAAFLGVEYLMIRKYPKSAKFFSILNWTDAGITSAVAARNYSLR